MVKELDTQEVEEMYEIDLKQYNLKVFYEKIVELVSLNMGWMNYQKAIFDTIEERDYCLLELEEKLGVRGFEVLKFKGAAKELYNALKSAFPDIKLSEKKQDELKKIFLEIISLDFHEIVQLRNIDKRLKINKKLRKYEIYNLSKKDQKQNYLKLKVIDDKLKEILFK